MNGLWADSWFYISAGGFLLSSVLFVFLLGQYRAAVEAEEGEDGSAQPVPAPIPTAKAGVLSSEKSQRSFASFPQEKGPVPVVSAPKLEGALPSFAPPPAPAAAPAVQGPPGGIERRKSGQTTSSEISPAVVYLQNIKMQMEKLDKDLLNLKSLASQQAAQGELILQRLSELTGRISVVEAGGSSAPPVQKSDTQELPVPAVAAPEAAAPPPAPEPALSLSPEPSPEATLFIEPTVVQTFHKPKPAPQPFPQADAGGPGPEAPPASAKLELTAGPFEAAAPGVDVIPKDARDGLPNTAAPGVNAPPQGAEDGLPNPAASAEAPKEESKPAEQPKSEPSAQEPKSARKGPVWPI